MVRPASNPPMVAAFRSWTARRWLSAAIAALVTAVLIGVPTDVIPNPVFGRPVDVTWWSYPSLVVTAVLGGLLIATYVRDSGGADDELDRPGKTGGLGGLLSFFAVGCPTCNKLVVVALGSSGALDWFAPAQPVLAVAWIFLLGWAVRARLWGQIVCRIAT
ncbi:MAG: hypothetical protein ACO4CU_14185 [Ilumatobacteraceae bacterium]